MANHKKKSGGAFLAGVIVTLLAALGLGEFGIGNFEGGLISDIFAPQEQTMDEVTENGIYDYEVMIVGDVITLDGEEVTIDELKAELADKGSVKVLMIDGDAYHASWEEVLDALSELDCIIDTK